jgi:hypothetical protein
MDKEVDIFLTHSDGNQYELLLSKTVVMLGKEGQLSIRLNNFNKWQLDLVFKTDKNEKANKGETKIEGNKLTYTLTNWFSADGVHNGNPVSMKSKSGKEQLLLRLETTALERQDFRKVSFSIWRKIPT